MATVPVTLQSLHTYPLKSARAIDLKRARASAMGLPWDRHFMAVDADGSFLTQRTLPRLARIVPELAAAELLLHAPGAPPLTVPLAPAGEPVPVRIWRHAGTALDAGPAAARWLSEVLGRPARLVRVAPDSARAADRTYAGELPAPLAFPDGFPLLIVNRASLDAINAHLPQAVPMNRFRPNVVLDGLAPFAEDHIEVIETCGARLRLVKPCTRCVVPSIDQITGAPGTDPTPVLRRLRFDKVLRGVTFGVNAVLEGAGGTLERGAGCTVTLRAAAGL